MAWASITYPEHPSTLVAAVSTYYEQESYMDVSFMCAGLERVEAHRLVLTSVSPFMKTLLMEHCGPEPPVISLPDVSQHLLRLVLQFLYDGVMKVNQDELAEFKNILTVLGIKVPNATVVKLNERIPTKLNPSKDPFVRRPPKRPSPVAQSRSPALVAVPPPTPSKVTNVDPSDDPLNVPDYYFRPQPSQPETANATVSSATSSTATPIIEPDPMPMDDEEEEEATALEIPVSRSSVTLQTSSPTVPTVNTSRRSTRSSIKPATPQQQPPPSPEVLIKVEREDEDMNQSNSSLVNTSYLQPPLNKEVSDCEGMRNNSKQKNKATRSGFKSDHKVIPLQDTDSNNETSEETANWFKNIQIKVEMNPELIKTVWEGHKESPSLTPQSSSKGTTIMPRKIWRSRKESAYWKKEIMADTAAKEKASNNLDAQHLFAQTLTENQVTVLNKEFEANSLPPAHHIQKLSAVLNLPESKVEGWFHHKWSERTQNIERGRTDLNKRQLRRLTEEFQLNCYPPFEHFSKLSQELGLTELRVCQWFTAQRWQELKKKVNPGKLTLTPEQSRILNKEFLREPTPTINHCSLLAQKIDMSPLKIFKWFENRRYRMKKQDYFNMAAEYGKILLPNEQKLRCHNQEFSNDPKVPLNNYDKSAQTLGLPKTRGNRWLCKKQRLFSHLSTNDAIAVNGHHLESLYKMHNKPGAALCKNIQKYNSNFRKVNDKSDSSLGKLRNRAGAIADNYCEIIDPGNTKKRHLFSKNQIEKLNKEFSANMTPSYELRIELANQLGVSTQKLNRWFQHRRRMERNQISDQHGKEKRAKHLSTSVHLNSQICKRSNKKKKRSYLNLEQLSRLKTAFVDDFNPPKENRKMLALELGLKEEKVLYWFKAVRQRMLQAGLKENDRAARQQMVARVTPGPHHRRYMAQRSLERQADTEMTTVQRDKMSASAGLQSVVPVATPGYQAQTVSPGPSAETVGADNCVPPLTEPTLTAVVDNPLKDDIKATLST